MYTKLAIAIIIAVLGFGGGWFVRKGVDSQKREALVTELSKASGSLFVAEAALRQNSATFKAINIQHKLDKEAANTAKKQAEASAKAALEDKAKSDQALAAIRNTASKEKQTCPEGRVKICGTPLL